MFFVQTLLHLLPEYVRICQDGDLQHHERLHSDRGLPLLPDASLLDVCQSSAVTSSTLPHGIGSRVVESYLRETTFHEYYQLVLALFSWRRQVLNFRHYDPVRATVEFGFKSSKFLSVQAIENDCLCCVAYRHCIFDTLNNIRIIAHLIQLVIQCCPQHFTLDIPMAFRSASLNVHASGS